MLEDGADQAAKPKGRSLSYRGFSSFRSYSPSRSYYSSGGYRSYSSGRYYYGGGGLVIVGVSFPRHSS